MVQSEIATVAGYMSLASAIIMFFILAPIIRRYMDRKKKNTFYLAISIVCWALTSIFAANIYFFSEDSLTWVIWCQKLVYVGVFLGTMFTFQFSQEIFFTLEKKKIQAYWLIGVVVIVLTLILDSVEIGVFPDGSGYPLLTISLEFSIAVVLFIIPTVLGIFYKALKTASKIDDKVYKLGFRVIAIGQLMIFATFITDTLATLVTDNIGLYAWMLYLTWIFPLIGILCYYVGWIMPNWLRKLFKIEENK